MGDLEENALVETKQFLSGVAERVLADHFDRREQVLHVKNIILSLIAIEKTREYEGKKEGRRGFKGEDMVGLYVFSGLGAL